MPEAAAPARVPVVGLLLGAGAAAALTMVLVLLLGGGAPPAAVPGLPTAGPVLDWTLAVSPLASNLLAAAVVGLFLLASGLLHSTGRTQAAAAAAATLAGGWVVLSLLLASVAALRIQQLAPPSAFWAEVAGSGQVRASVSTAVLAAVAGAVVRARPRLGFCLVLVALIPEALTGHVRTAEAPALTTVMVFVHVVAASLWLGGLVALGWTALRHPASWSEQLTGFSRMALGCVVVLVVTGSVSALAVGGGLGALVRSEYGVVVSLKAVLLLALATIGLLQRRYVIAHGSRSRRDFVLLAGSELILMGLVFSLATGLSQTPPM